MTPEQLLRAIGSVDDIRLDECEQSMNVVRQKETTPKTRSIFSLRWRQWTGLAACACLLLICLTVPNTFKQDTSYEAKFAMTTEEDADAQAEEITDAQAEAITDAGGTADTLTEEPADIQSEESKDYSAVAYPDLLVNDTSYRAADDADIQACLSAMHISAFTADSCDAFLGAAVSEDGSTAAEAYSLRSDTSGADLSLILVRFPDNSYILYCQE